MTTTMKLWIPGGNGMLATTLRAQAHACGLEVVATGREVDVTDADACLAFARRERPVVVINCAAYTAVDKAESEEELARRVNGDGARFVGAAAAAVGARALHVSTDYVFDGSAVRPWREDDPTGPLSAYGRSKLVGEQGFLQATDGEGIVVRTSWVYGPHGKNFVSTMLRLMAEREELRVVDDQHGRPTSTETLASALLSLVGLDDDPAHRASGVVHYADSGATTWHGFATAIFEGARARGMPVKARTIHAISTTDFPTPARRPAYSVLDTTRFTTLTGQTPPPWSAPLGRCLDALAAGSR